MHLIWACRLRPLEVPYAGLPKHPRHSHYLLIQQPAADWEHLHERPQLLMLLQQLRQVLPAAGSVGRDGGPDLRRHGPPGREAAVRTVQPVHGDGGGGPSHPSDWGGGNQRRDGTRGRTGVESSRVESGRGRDEREVLVFASYSFSFLGTVARSPF
jgi:hypothetical protein